MIYHLSKCPVCGENIDRFYATSAKEPFAHTDPLIGLLVWGAYSIHKETICATSEYVHFKIGDETRLVAINQEADSDELLNYLQNVYEAESAIVAWWEEDDEENRWWEEDDDDEYEEFYSPPDLSESLDNLPF